MLRACDYNNTLLVSKYLSYACRQILSNESIEWAIWHCMERVLSCMSPQHCSLMPFRGPAIVG